MPDTSASLAASPIRVRPIIFSAPMIRAILAGTKTQTRRIVKPQPELRAIEQVGHMLGFKKRRGDGFWLWPNAHDRIVTECPHGQVGHRLWVRETWHTVDGESAFYRADYMHDPKGDKAHGIIWRPSIFMPRWASRITLEVVSVRVERLQDISEADAMAEGVERTVVGDGWRRYDADPDTEAAGLTPCANPVSSYRSLWESINGPGSWADNPFVWVVEFKRLEHTA